MVRVSRRELFKSGLAARSPGLLEETAGDPVKLARIGWCWEGQGFTGAAGASIFGLGGGAKFFGLKRVFNLYGPNDELAMERLRFCDEVVCEISLSRAIRCGERCVQSHYNPDPEAVLEEAKTAARLASMYHNITGAYFDDSLGSQPPSLTPEQYASVYDVLKGAHRGLKFWALVFSTQLYQQDWGSVLISPFRPYMDVINLWVWDSKDLRDLDRHINRCREIFPDKPIMLGCFLWDYASMKWSQGDFVKGHAVPMDLLRLQWEGILKHAQAGTLAGYTILGACLIDWAQEQSRWIRDFIAAN